MSSLLALVLALVRRWCWRRSSVGVGVGEVLALVRRWCWHWSDVGVGVGVGIGVTNFNL